jgi:hypothetical protein
MHSLLCNLQESMEPESSLPSSQKPATSPFPEHMKRDHTILYFSYNIHFNVIIILLFILTANGVSPGGSDTTIIHNTQSTNITQNNTTIKRNTAYTKLHSHSSIRIGFPIGHVLSVFSCQNFTCTALPCMLHALFIVLDCSIAILRRTS